MKPCGHAAHKADEGLSTRDLKQEGEKDYTTNGSASLRSEGPRHGPNSPSPSDREGPRLGRNTHLAQSAGRDPLSAIRRALMRKQRLIDRPDFFMTGGIYAVLLAGMMVCQLDILASPFLPMTDLVHALGSPGIRDWGRLPALFSRDYGAVFWEYSYHPLYTLTTFANHALFGLDPRGFRIFQILILWINAILVGRLCRKELGSWAWTAVFLYALSPCRSGWSMLDVKDSLVTLFCLLGLSMHRRAGRMSYPLAYGGAVGICYGLALASKESGAVFPALLLVMDLFQGAIPKGSSQRRRWMLCYLSCALVIAGYGLLRYKIMGYTIGYSPVDSWSDILTRLGGYAWELAALKREVLRGWFFFLFLSFMASTIWMASNTGKRLAIASIIWIFLGIFPVSGLIPIESLSLYLRFVVNEAPCRYLTLSGVGYAWLLGVGLRESLGRRRWAWSLLPLFFCAMPLWAQLDGYRRRAQPDYSISACARAGGMIWGGENCTHELTRILLSLRMMKKTFPDAYAGYAPKLQELLGDRFPSAEEYFGGLLEYPCRLARHLYRSPVRDFLKFLQAIDADHAVRAGRDSLHRGRVSEALSRFQTAFRLDPEHPDVYYQRAAAYWQLGQHAAAAQQYNTYRLISGTPRSIGPWCQEDPQEDPADRASEILMNVIIWQYAQESNVAGSDPGEDRRKSLECVIQVARFSPREAGRYLDLGGAGLRRSGGKDAAAPRDAMAGTDEWQRLSRSVLRNVARSEAPTPACAGLNWRGELSGQEWTRATALPPARDVPPDETPGYWIDLAESALAARQRGLALGYLERARARHPGARDYERMAIFYHRIGEYPRALQVLDELVKFRPSDARGLNDRGVLHSLMGRNAEAADDFRAAMDADPEFFPSYLGLGALHASGGRYAEALQVYETALARMPSSAPGDVAQFIRSEHRALMLKVSGRPVNPSDHGWW